MSSGMRLRTCGGRSRGSDKQAELAVRRFHLGQLALLMLSGREAGVLRLSAGARLVDSAALARPEAGHIRRCLRLTFQFCASSSRLLALIPIMKARRATGEIRTYSRATILAMRKWPRHGMAVTGTLSCQTV